MSDSAFPSAGERRTRRLALEMDDFGWKALQGESARLGVSEEEIVRHALLYYLADLDSGRIARRAPPEPAQQSTPTKQ